MPDRGTPRSAVVRHDDRPLVVRLPRLALRLVAVWVAETLGLLLVAATMPGVGADGPASAAFAVALIGLLNALLYPAIASAASLLAPGVFAVLALLLNAAIVLLATSVDSGVTVSPLGAFVLVLVLGLLNALVSNVLALGDEDSFHRGVVARRARRSRRRDRMALAARAGVDLPPADVPDLDAEPGLLLLEIDGLAEPVLRDALRDGHLPTLKRWIEAGSHEITPWETDASSQTAASQAGLLHGENGHVPAFRWYDRELGRVVVSTNAEDAQEIERRASLARPGLLAMRGASRSNLVSGGAPRATLTFAALRRPTDRRARAEDWRAFLGNPYSLPRTMLLFVYDVGSELRAARRQRQADVRPRVGRGGLYPFVRAATTSAIQEVTLSMLVGDVLRGAPVAYATFVAYDEVAHHSGIRAPDALRVLQRLDRHVGRLERAAADGPRPYRIVVLSDHGQSQGATFRQLHGRTLEQVVDDLVAGPVADARATSERESEASELLGLALAEAAEVGGGAGRAAERAAARRERLRVARDARRATAEGAAPGERGDTATAELGARPAADADAPDGSGTAPGRPDAEEGVLVLASGSLGLVYLRDERERPDLERIAERAPALVPGLAAHPGVAAVCGLLPDGTAIALGAHGRHDLHAGTVDGIDPLEGLGERAAMHLRRNLAIPTAPDLLVLGRLDPRSGEVCAFEELVGHHGGLGGSQAEAFLLHPVDLPVPDEELVGAAAVHEVLRGWLPADARVLNPARLVAAAPDLVGEATAREAASGASAGEAAAGRHADGLAGEAARPPEPHEDDAEERSA